MIGVLLLGFGCPQTLKDVEPFLKSVLGEKRITPGILEKTLERYRAIGGGSPLRTITERQVCTLQSYLGNDFAVGMGFLHSQPRIPEAMKALSHEGVREIIGVSLAPHANRHSTWAYKKESEAAAGSLGLTFTFSRSFHTHPLYIQALSEKVRERLAEGTSSNLLFTAHSLPSEGDDVTTYMGEVQSTIGELLKAMAAGEWRPLSWSLAYQSRGPGPGRWLGPSAEEALETLSAQGASDVVVLPLSFVSDHLETLYDVDILYRKKAESLGMSLRRVGALNDSPLFIQMLRQLVLQEIT